MCRSAASWLVSAKSWIQPESRIDMESEWSFQMLMGAPMARLPMVITMGSPRPDGVVDRFGHEQQALAGRRSISARASGRCADRHRKRAEFRFHVQEFAAGQRARLHHLPQRLHDVRLRRDGISADHLRPAHGHGFGHAREPSICFHMDFLPVWRVRLWRRDRHALGACAAAAFASPILPANFWRIAASTDRSAARRSSPQTRPAACCWVTDGRRNAGPIRWLAPSAHDPAAKFLKNEAKPSSSKLRDELINTISAGLQVRRTGRSDAVAWDLE